MLPLPTYLPLSHHLKNGDEIIIRAMRLDEIQLFYATVKMAAESNSGYGWDEVQNKRHFCRWYVHDYYNIVYEQSSSGRVISFSNFGASLYSRSRSASALVDGNNIILPEFRGRRLSEEIVEIHMKLAVDCGFTCMIGETAATNLPTLAGMLSGGFFNVGSVPKAVFFRNVGWVDSIVFYRALSKDQKPLHDIVGNVINANRSKL